MPEPITARVLSPLWTPLGYESTPWGRRYWLVVRGQVRKLRAGQMYGVGFLVDVYPYLEHWRRSFPYGYGRKIDCARACTYFVTECERMGIYTPSD